MSRDSLRTNLRRCASLAGALRQKHLPAYPDEFVFRNRRTATSISPSFARLIQHAIQLQPTADRALVSS